MTTETQHELASIGFRVINIGPLGVVNARGESEKKILYV